MNTARLSLQHEDSGNTCKYLNVGKEEQMQDEIDAMQEHWWLLFEQVDNYVSDG